MSVDYKVRQIYNEVIKEVTKTPEAWQSVLRLLPQPAEERPDQDSSRGRARPRLQQTLRPGPDRILRHLWKRHHRFRSPPGGKHLPYCHDPYRPPDDGRLRILNPPLRPGR